MPIDCDEPAGACWLTLYPRSDQHPQPDQPRTKRWQTSGELAQGAWAHPGAVSAPHARSRPRWSSPGGERGVGGCRSCERCRSALAHVRDVKW